MKRALENKVEGVLNERNEPNHFIVIFLSTVKFYFRNKISKHEAIINELVTLVFYQ